MTKEEAIACMKKYSREEAAGLMQEYLVDPAASICARVEWVEAAWALVAYARYAKEEVTP